jgi:IS5 family transposase
VCERWLENPYWQFLFRGFDYLQHRLPIEPSSPTRWRESIGASGMERLLVATIEAALATGAVKSASLERVTVDTTVQPEAIALSARFASLPSGPARCRKIVNRPATASHFAQPLARVARLLAQQKSYHSNLYSMHAPEVECLAKGKAHKRYEFGVKVSVTATNREGLVFGMMVLPGNPYDEHTLATALAQVERMTGVAVARAYAERRYRGHGLDSRRVFLSGQRRGVTATIRRELRRHSAIEPVIGQMKADGALVRPRP